MAKKTTTKKEDKPVPQTPEDCTSCEQSNECLENFKSEFSQLVVDTRVGIAQLAEKYNVDKIAAGRTLASAIQASSPLMYVVLRTQDDVPVTILQAEFVSVDNQGSAMLHLYVPYADCFQTAEEAKAAVDKYKEDNPGKYKKSIESDEGKELNQNETDDKN